MRDVVAGRYAGWSWMVSEWAVVEVGVDESWWWIGRLVCVGGVAVVGDVAESVG